MDADQWFARCAQAEDLAMEPQVALSRLANNAAQYRVAKPDERTAKPGYLDPERFPKSDPMFSCSADWLRGPGQYGCGCLLMRLP